LRPCLLNRCGARVDLRLYSSDRLRWTGLRRRWGHLRNCLRNRWRSDRLTLGLWLLHCLGQWRRFRPRRRIGFLLCGFRF